MESINEASFMANKRMLYPDIDTPVLLVDLDKLDENIREMTQVAKDAGVKLRPHIKVHESSEIAKMQIEAGAIGIEVGPITMAEAMAESGINDILVAHPGYYGGHKYETLKRLLGKRRLKLTIVVDMYEQAEGVSRAGQEVGREVPLIIKVDTNTNATGLPRYGVLPGEPALQLAKQLSLLPHIKLLGVYSHEIGGSEGPAKMAFKTAEQLTETARLIKKEGLNIEHVSTGASPTFRHTCRYIKDGRFSDITEIHPGSCVLGDISYLTTGGNLSMDTCAASVLVTVMSTAHSDWVVIDTGYKTFGSLEVKALETWRGMPSRGAVKGRPDLFFGFLCAETTMVYYTDPKKRNLSIGDRLEIIPNSEITVSNTKDVMYGVRKGRIEHVFKVDARGRGV
jgi:D-serine deaminase-like pyridoxal phosphate-dependent protein